MMSLTSRTKIPDFETQQQRKRRSAPPSSPENLLEFRSDKLRPVEEALDPDDEPDKPHEDPGLRNAAAAQAPLSAAEQPRKPSRVQIGQTPPGRRSPRPG